MSSALLLGTVLIGLYLVWLPEHATVAAQLIGVGRGADLLLYCWIMINLVVVLHMRLKIHATNVIVTELARAIALQQPCRPAGADQRAAGGPPGTADTPSAAGPTASGYR